MDFPETAEAVCPHREIVGLRCPQPAGDTTAVRVFSDFCHGAGSKMHRVAKTVSSATLCAAALWLTACTTPPKPAQQAAQPPACTAVGGDDVLVGNWLSVDSRKGVAGSLRTLYTLNLDGTMTYVEQLKRPGKPSQGLHKSGCWHRGGNALENGRA